MDHVGDPTHQADHPVRQLELGLLGGRRQRLEQAQQRHLVAAGELGEVGDDRDRGAQHVDDVADRRQVGVDHLERRRDRGDHVADVELDVVVGDLVDEAVGGGPGDVDVAGEPEDALVLGEGVEAEAEPLLVVAAEAGLRGERRRRRGRTGRTSRLPARSRPWCRRRRRGRPRRPRGGPAGSRRSRRSAPDGRDAATSISRASSAPMTTCGPTPRFRRRVTGSVQLVVVSTSLSERTSSPARPVSNAVFPSFSRPVRVVPIVIALQPVGLSVMHGGAVLPSVGGAGHGVQAPAVPPQVTSTSTSVAAMPARPSVPSTARSTALSSSPFSVVAVVLPATAGAVSSSRRAEVSSVRMSGTPAPASRSVPMSGAETGVPVVGSRLRGAAPSMAESSAAASPSRPSARNRTCIGSGAGCVAPAPPEESVASAA